MKRWETILSFKIIEKNGVNLAPSETRTCNDAVRATSHLTISMRGQRTTYKNQRNNYHHGNRGLSLTGKTWLVSLIFTHRTHRNVKNR